MARKQQGLFIKVSGNGFANPGNGSNAPEYALFCGGCATFWQLARAADKPARDDSWEVGGYNPEKM
jgi:hypothetical protein